ncbi:hypothetical protein [Desulfovibrio inopinatus]|uniref:hypothetical protein n=1 Tax=Desulfovibrio inopinatus TaxID=102109 RepID=UPI0003F4C5CF|nr:hypothetical protein [Desulfovibrio inopinatus]
MIFNEYVMKYEVTSSSHCFLEKEDWLESASMMQEESLGLLIPLLFIVMMCFGLIGL